MIDFNFGVHLGPLDKTHMPWARDARNDQRVMRWCRQADLISDSEQMRWFDAQDADPKIKMYTIFQSGAQIGVCGFTSICRLPSHAEFSLYISPSQQGAGLGSKALKTLLCHGFRNLGFQQIWGETMAGNRALEVFERVGFKIDGKRRDFYFKEGQTWDAYMISMTQEEWKEQEWSMPSQQ